MDPRSLFFSSSGSSIARQPPSSTSDAVVESRGLVAPASAGQHRRHPSSTTGSSISSASSSPNIPPVQLQYGQHPPQPPLTSPQGTAPHPSSFGGQGSFYSSSAPTELYQSPPQAIGYTPSTAPPLTASFPGSTGGGGGTGGKVRKGKDRAARPVLGLRVKSEDNSSTTNQDASKTRAQYSACGCVTSSRSTLLDTRLEAELPLPVWGGQGLSDETSQVRVSPLLSTHLPSLSPPLDKPFPVSPLTHIDLFHLLRQSARHQAPLPNKHPPQPSLSALVAPQLAGYLR